MGGWGGGQVGAMQPGLSAAQSNQIEVGDDLVEIDGCSVNGMTLEETRAKLTGKRSSKVLPLLPPTPARNIRPSFVVAHQ